MFPAVPSAATTTTIAQIVGTWSSGGAVIKVTGGGGSFQGTVVSGKFGACDAGVPGKVIWQNISGSGLSYSGTIPYVNLNDCSSAGDGPATFTLSDINHGTYKATSPDGTVHNSGSFTRQGVWPGAATAPKANKPKTSCKKNGKPVLCSGQKAVSNNLAWLADAIAKLQKQLTAANKKADKKKAVDLATKMNDKILQAQNKNKKIVSDGNLKTFEDLWKLFKLPTKEKGPLAKEMAGNQAKQFLFGDQADKTLAQNNNLLQTADQRYKDNPAIATELDNAALYGATGVRYDQLSPSDRLKAAAQIEGTLGTQFDYTNNAADLGIKGLKFTYTTKGAKL